MPRLNKCLRKPPKWRFFVAQRGPFAVCFKNRAQKEAFLRAMKWLECGDEYLPDELVAAMQGIELPDGDVALRSVPRTDKDYSGLAID